MHIEKNVPLPDRRPRLHAPSRPSNSWPYARMDVGDSFLVDVTGMDRAKIQQVRVYASMRGKVLGRRFATSMVADGLRIWRVS